MTDRPEWLLARRILAGEDDWAEVTVDEVLQLAREVERLRELAEVKYELVLAHTGRDTTDELRKRIDKLYMSLNARARGDENDFDGDPAKPWNNLVSALSYALVKAVANGKWAVAEHRKAGPLREALDDLWGCISAIEIGNLRPETVVLASTVHEAMSHTAEA